MRKRILFLISLFTITPAALAMTRDAKLTNTTGYNYNYMYPYMNNAMRTNLNPGVTTSQSLSPINTVVKTTALPNTTARRVVPRRTSNARTATPQSAPTALNNSRRVISRGASGATSRRAIPTATTPGARLQWRRAQLCVAHQIANKTHTYIAPAAMPPPWQQNPPRHA